MKGLPKVGESVKFSWPVRSRRRWSSGKREILEGEVFGYNRGRLRVRVVGDDHMVRNCTVRSELIVK